MAHALPEVAVAAAEAEQLGSCVLARNSATPHLKPTSTVSEKKLMIEPARAAQAANASAATIRPVHAARAAWRAGSPADISPSVAPTSSEIAEVTVTAVCRELQNSQNTRPANRQA
jgi:hypothetical protein